MVWPCYRMLPLIIQHLHCPDRVAQRIMELLSLAEYGVSPLWLSGLNLRRKMVKYQYFKNSTLEKNSRQKDVTSPVPLRDHIRY